ncbi:MAG: hypothetical protein WCE21_02095 [Candidatus Babeliales bacterium]
MNYLNGIIICVSLYGAAIADQQKQLQGVAAQSMLAEPSPSQSTTPAPQTGQVPSVPQVVKAPHIINRGPAIPIRAINNIFDQVAQDKQLQAGEKEKIKLLIQIMNTVVITEQFEQFPPIDKIVAAFAFVRQCTKPLLDAIGDSMNLFTRGLNLIERRYNDRVNVLTQQLQKADPTTTNVQSLNEQLSISTAEATTIHRAVDDAITALNKKQAAGQSRQSTSSLKSTGSPSSVGSSS